MSASATNANSRQPLEPDLTDDAPLRAALDRYWGFPGFRPLQQDAMSLVMSDRDSLVVLPTGGGKSLCYQVPAVCRDGLALVVSPLISLMKDQVDALQAIGIRAACINSSQTTRENSDVAELIRRRELKLLYVAPERFVQTQFAESLNRAGVSFVAIDEAHCISQWGHDFRPEYRQLKSLKSIFPGVSIHGYTATATEQVREDIVEQLGLRDATTLVGSFDRPNLLYRIERRTDAIGQIQHVLERHRGESGIVYCITRKNVEATCEALCRLGYRAKPYHAGMSDDDRRRNQEFFIDGDDGIMVATVAFGMGIDKSNVRFVIHAEMPKTLENYQQESGRAGRDGLEAECCLLYSAKDVMTWQYFMQDMTDPDVRKTSEAALEAMQQYCVSTRCRHRQLVEHFGQRFDKQSCGACDVCLNELPVVADALIVAQKILSGVVRQGERFGAAYTAQVLKGSRAKKIVENRHDQLSTWGLLKDEPEPQIRGWIDQLISQGFLATVSEYNLLTVTPTGRQLLKGQLTPHLLRTPGAEMEKEKAARVTADASWAGVDRPLFDRLRELRTELAHERNVPPYIIFSDATLRELARIRPTADDRLLQVPGIGARKRDDFGTSVLDVISNWCRAHDLSTDLQPASLVRARTSDRPARSTVTAQLKAARYTDLFEQRWSMEEVALQLEVTVDTVSKYLGEYIAAHRIDDVSPWVTPEQQRRVEEAAGQLGAERLKPIFEHLNSEVPYSHLRIALTAWQMRQQAEDD